MSPRTLLVLMVVFIGLGTFAIFDPLRRKEKAEATKDRQERVAWLEGKKLEKIRIAGTGKHQSTELLCALKDGCPFDGTGEWTLAEPAGTKADPTSAGTLASTILNLKHNEALDFAPGNPDPKEFGLEQPAAELTLHLKGEPAPLTLRFGKAAAVGPNVYLSSSLDPQKVFLVPSYVPDMVNKEPFHWQSKRLFPGVESTSFQRIGWADQKAKTKEIRAERVDGQWRLQKPVSASASQMMFEGLASTVAYAAAKSVWSPSRDSVQAKSLLKQKPELELAFTAGGGQSHMLRLYPKPGAADPRAPGAKELVAAVDSEPALFAVDSVTFDRFRKDLKEYRQRSSLSDAERAQVDEVRFEFLRDKTEATFRLEGGPGNGQWKQSGGEPLKEALSQGRLTAFLDSLRDADFLDYLPKNGASPEAQAWRTQAPELRVELKGGGKAIHSATYVVLKKGVAITEAEGELRLLGAQFLQQIPVRVSDLGELANKQVVNLEETGTGEKPGKAGADGNHGNGNDPHAGHAH